jgi:cation diffusion facilitator CzcD-associated flavoprotein CzcO
VSEHIDVVIVGAGLSGIGAGCQLRRRCPEKTFVILEAREAIGGTWDLFRYPGIRSDSDMFTLGYSFKPWTGRKAIADGASILEYIREAAREYGIEERIRFRHRVRRAFWSSDEAQWTVEVEVGPHGEMVRFVCSFLWMCAGYYDYEEGYTPELPGRERYRGRLVHPQFWNDTIEYEGKRVVVIGSGATAMTLVPQLAKKAAHVTMLQRSPTYVLSVPDEDRVANVLRGRLPDALTYAMVRWKNIALGMLLFELCRRRPTTMKTWLVGRVRKAVGPDEAAAHFTPRYNPWDQRLCLLLEDDLFESIRAGKTSVVTDHIETFTERGILLRSGRELEADLIVTATGLKLLFLGGVELTIDGRRFEPAHTMTYKGVMFRDVPNLACTFGYTNASWTLKADLTAEYVCRLLRYMDAVGARICTARLTDSDVEERPFVDLSSGYIQRAVHAFPRQGSKRPWRVYQNYLLDLFLLRYGEIDDGCLEFRTPDGRARLGSRKRRRWPFLRPPNPAALG